MIPYWMPMTIGAILIVASLIGLQLLLMKVKDYNKNDFVTIGIILIIAFSCGCWVFGGGIFSWVQHLN
jgi:hypothetical protein